VKVTVEGGVKCAVGGPTVGRAGVVGVVFVLCVWGGVFVVRGWVWLWVAHEAEGDGGPSWAARCFRREGRTCHTKKARREWAAGTGEGGDAGVGSAELRGRGGRGWGVERRNAWKESVRDGRHAG